MCFVFYDRNEIFTNSFFLYNTGCYLIIVFKIRLCLVKMHVGNSWVILFI